MYAASRLAPRLTPPVRLSGTLKQDTQRNRTEPRPRRRAHEAEDEGIRSFGLPAIQSTLDAGMLFRSPVEAVRESIRRVGLPRFAGPLPPRVGLKEELLEDSGPWRDRTAPNAQDDRSVPLVELWWLNFGDDALNDKAEVLQFTADQQNPNRRGGGPDLDNIGTPNHWAEHFGKPASAASAGLATAPLRLWWIVSIETAYWQTHRLADLELGDAGQRFPRRRWCREA